MEVTSIKPTLLCVDENQTFLHFRKLVLESAGYLVLIAGDSASAMEIFASARVALVMTDDCLRDGTGIELAKAMKRLKPDVPIAILSALVDAPEGIGFADLFICKADSPPTVLSKIAELLSARSDTRRRTG